MQLAIEMCETLLKLGSASASASAGDGETAGDGGDAAAAAAASSSSSSAEAVAEQHSAVNFWWRPIDWQRYSVAYEMQQRELVRSRLTRPRSDEKAHDGDTSSDEL